MNMLESNKGKVLFVLDGWNNAGTEIYVSMLISQLINKGEFIPAVLTLNKNNNKYNDSIKSVIDFYEPESEKWSKSDLKEKIKEINPVIIHNHLYSSLFSTILLEKQFKEKVIVNTFHCPLNNWNFIQRQKWWLSAIMSDCVIGVSVAVTNQFKNKPFLPHDKIFTMNPLVRIENARNKNKKCYYLIMGVGRLSNREKDWLALINAFHRVKSVYKSHPIKLRIVGGGPDESVLRKEIVSLNLCDCVELTGPVSQREVSEYLAEADLFVLPSRFEGFGIAAVEAMQMGIPVITSDYPASFDYIDDGKTGFHFPIGDASALADKIEYCYLNREEADVVAKTGQQFAFEKFAPEKIAEQHIEIYNRLLSAVRQRHS